MNIEGDDELCWNLGRMLSGRSLVSLNIGKDERRSSGSTDIQQEMTSRTSSVNPPHGQLLAVLSSGLYSVCIDRDATTLYASLPYSGVSLS